MEVSEFDQAIQEASDIVTSLNMECKKYFEIKDQITEYQARRLRPFALENGDADAALEGLIQGAHNVASKIKNFIIKLWYAIKNALDKMLHLFDGTLRKLKGYRDTFKGGIDNSKMDAFFETRLKVYRKVDMQKRLGCLAREVNMKWTETDGTVNWRERRSLAEIGHGLKENGKGGVVQSYTGTFPINDTLGSHGYTFADVTAFLNQIIDIYEKYPDYKENLKKMCDGEIDSRYKSVGTSEQKHLVLLADRCSFIMVQKLTTIVLKEMREIGHELVAICGAIK